MAGAAAEPEVHAKGIERVVMKRRIKPLYRLDVFPFCILYGAILAKMVLHASRFEWDSLTIWSYIMGGCGLLQILTHLGTHWSRSWQARVTCLNVSSLSQAEILLVIPAKFAGAKELVPVVRNPVKDGILEVDEVGFEFRRQRFVYNAEINAFEKLRYPDKDTFGTYQKWTGHGSDAKQLSAFDRYGANRFDVPLPSFGSLLMEHMLAPFFCFQVFCVGLWCLDEYWYYSLFTLFMLVTFECTVVGQRLRNLRELRALQTPKQHTHVYRCGKWELMPGEALLPGDVISIGRPSGGPAAEERVVPADCLLLAGTAIVEEAVLTGESTPQWKVHIGDTDPNTHLNMKLDKQYILFGGTKILQHTGDKAARIRTPDGGCLAVVLRTGFETAQGRLMRTILFSSERVTANSWEAGAFICFLLVFAIAAAYHVASEGLKDPSRSRFKLLLNCIMIITSVIPPELPMELSMAVNASLLALSRKKVFCTEPFRIPFAGKVEVCCFDKTGTLTSDHLLLEGVVADPDPRPEPPKRSKAAAAAAAASSKGSKGRAAAAAVVEEEAEESEDEEAAVAAAAEEARDPDLLCNPARYSRNTCLVLAGCHSLVTVNDELVGDPLEKAALEAVGWTYSGETALSPCRKVRASLLTRYHFSSGLRRSSVVVRLEDDGFGGSGTALPAPVHMVLAKGAPEVIKDLLADVPPQYDQQYKRYAAQGARVIALAVREVSATEAGDASALRSLTRDQVESRLRFAGFAVFQCPLKPESEPALAALAGSSHQLVMITGDAPLTAVYAASKVHIVTREVLVLGHREEDKGHGGLSKPTAVPHISRSGGKGHSSSGSKADAKALPPPPGEEHDAEYVWMSPDESVKIPFSRRWEDLLQVASQYDLAVSGDALRYAEAVGTPLVQRLIPLCQVFARVSPDQKELVLVTLRAAGFTTLMCGDGTNDVGGLKAAHVGVALLSASESAEKLKQLKQAAEAKKGRKGGAKPAAGSATAAGAGATDPKAAAGGKAGAVVPSGPAGAPGDVLAAAGGAAGAAAGKAKAGGKRGPGTEMLERARAAGRPVTPAMEKMAAWLDEMEAGAGGGAMGDDMPMLKPGDASMASPFTAKASSVMPCTDILKQGRCTLVTTVQMFKILGLLCLSTAYSLSVMYLQGVKLGDVQATVTGMLTAANFLFISQSKPLETLSPVRPHPSIFTPYFFLSLLGQFGVHLGLIIYFYRAALAEMPPEERLASDAEFKPNLVNTVCYVVEATVQIMTFAVNYVGHPFNTSIRENKGLFNCIRYASMFVAVVAFDLVPGLSASFGMVPIPQNLRVQLLILAPAAFVVTWNWERFLRRAFPARVPPQKGYMVYEQELARAKKTA